MHSKLVYKYVSPERTDILKDNHIRFTQPNALNDPFEGMPSLIKFKETLFKSISEKTISRFGEDKAANTKDYCTAMIDVIAERFPNMLGNLFAFLSLSKNYNNPLMWSHYAKSHTGFVIGFDSANEFFMPGKFGRHGLTPVKYSDARYTLPLADLRLLNDFEMEETNIGTLQTKSLDWSYEDELRLFAMPTDANKKLDIPNQTPIFLFEFPAKAVELVIFGIRMSPKAKDELYGILSDKYPHASVMQAVLNETNFSVDCIPYKEYLSECKRLAWAREKTELTFHFKDENGVSYPAPWSN